MNKPSEKSARRRPTAAAVTMTAFVVGLVPWFFLGCRPSERAAGSDAIDVAVGVPPIGYLVQRIGGPRVKVEVLLPPGQSCAHDFSLSPKQVRALGAARLLVTVGMPFETQLAEKLRDTQVRVVDAAAGIARRTLSAEETGVARPADEATPGEPADAGARRVDDDTHPDGSRDHQAHDHDAQDHAAHDDADARPGDPDPHLWLAPAALRQLVANILASLVAVDPAHADEYRERAAALEREIDAVAARLGDTLGPLRGQTIYVYHPAFGYLTDAYGLRQKAVEVGGREPSTRRLRELVHQAQADHVQVIFVQPEFDSRRAEILAQGIGCRVATMDPLAPNVLDNLEKMARQIAGSAPATAPAAAPAGAH